MTGTGEARQMIADILRKIVAVYAPQKVILFGSYAYGKPNEDSDIDLLVQMAPGTSLFDHIALWQDLEDLLGCKVDVVSERALHWYIRDRVLQEAIPL